MTNVTREVLRKATDFVTLITWRSLWLKRQAAQSRLLELERELNGFVPEGDHSGIQDLSDPHGKRFLFDDIEGMAEQTTLRQEAMPAAPEVPSWGKELPVWSRTLRSCAPGCTCPCARCTRT